jgi:hypothetical protein
MTVPDANGPIPEPKPAGRPNRKVHGSSVLAPAVEWVRFEHSTAVVHDSFKNGLVALALTRAHRTAYSNNVATLDYLWAICHVAR